MSAFTFASVRAFLDSVVVDPGHTSFWAFLCCRGQRVTSVTIEGARLLGSYESLYPGDIVVESRTVEACVSFNPRYPQIGNLGARCVLRLPPNERAEFVRRLTASRISAAPVAAPASRPIKFKSTNSRPLPLP